MCQLWWGAGSVPCEVCQARMAARRSWVQSRGIHSEPPLLLRPTCDWCLELRQAAGPVRELSRGLGGSGPLCPRTCSYMALDSPGGGTGPLTSKPPWSCHPVRVASLLPTGTPSNRGAFLPSWTCQWPKSSHTVCGIRRDRPQPFSLPYCFPLISRQLGLDGQHAFPWLRH